MSHAEGWNERAELAMARHLVARLAPDELILFEETAAAAPRDGRAKRRREDPLGFGVMDAATVLFTTVACGVAGEVVKSLAEEAGREAAGRTRNWLRLLRRTRQPAPPDGADRIQAVAPLPPDVLADVRGVARRRALLLGLPEDRAELLADTVVAYLSERTGDGS